MRQVFGENREGREMLAMHLLVNHSKPIVLDSTTVPDGLDPLIPHEPFNTATGSHHPGMLHVDLPGLSRSRAAAH